jgi:hypothetical protein
LVAVEQVEVDSHGQPTLLEEAEQDNLLKDF